MNFALQIKVNGGAPQTGGIYASTGDVLQLTASNKDGWQGGTTRWNLVDYPDGYALPSGWTQDTNDAQKPTYYVQGVIDPSPFTLSDWGAFKTELVVNGLVVDRRTFVKVKSPAGIEPIARGEEGQFGGAQMQWVEPYNKNFRLLEPVIEGATATPSTSTPAAVALTGTVGTSTQYARGDHRHAHGVQTDGTLHALATTSTPGFLSAADKALIAILVALAPAGTVVLDPTSSTPAADANTALAAGHSVVLVPGATYNAETAVVWPTTPGSLRFGGFSASMPPAIWNPTWSPSSTLADDRTNALIKVEGAYSGTVSTTLSSECATGESVIHVTSGTGIVTGMWLAIEGTNYPNAGGVGSPAPYDFQASDNGAVVHRELVHVLSVSGTTITLTRPLKQSHWSALTVKSVSPVIGASVVNVALGKRGGTIANGITATYFDELTIANCDFYGLSRAGLDTRAGNGLEVVGIRAKGELNCLWLVDSVIRWSGAGIRATKSVTPHLYQHANGFPRHMISFRNRPCEGRLNDVYLCGGNGGLSTWGAHDYIMTNVQIEDFDPTQLIARWAGASNSEFPSGSSLGIGIDDGAGPVGAGGFAEFGLDCVWDNISVKDCITPAGCYAVFVHDKFRMSIGTLKVGWEDGAYNAGNSGLRMQDVSGVAQDVNVYGAEIGAYLTGAFATLEFIRLQTDGGGNRQLNFGRTRIGGAGIRIRKLFAEIVDFDAGYVDNYGQPLTFIEELNIGAGQPNPKQNLICAWDDSGTLQRDQIAQLSRTALKGPITSHMTGSSQPTFDSTSAGDGFYIGNGGNELVKIVFTAGGTVGVAGIFWKGTVDGGATYTAPAALGTANTITFHGFVFHLSAGAVNNGEYFAASIGVSIEPATVHSDHTVTVAIGRGGFDAAGPGWCLASLPHPVRWGIVKGAVALGQMLEAKDGSTNVLVPVTQDTQRAPSGISLLTDAGTGSRTVPYYQPAGYTPSAIASSSLTVQAGTSAALTTSDATSARCVQTYGATCATTYDASVTAVTCTISGTYTLSGTTVSVNCGAFAVGATSTLSLTAVSYINSSAPTHYTSDAGGSPAYTVSPTNAFTGTYASRLTSVTIGFLAAAASTNGGPYKIQGQGGGAVGSGTNTTGGNTKIVAGAVGTGGTGGTGTAGNVSIEHPGGLNYVGGYEIANGKRITGLAQPLSGGNVTIGAYDGLILLGNATTPIVRTDTNATNLSSAGALVNVAAGQVTFRDATGVAWDASPAVNVEAGATSATFSRFGRIVEAVPRRASAGTGAVTWYQKTLTNIMPATVKGSVRVTVDLICDEDDTNATHNGTWTYTGLIRCNGTSYAVNGTPLSTAIDPGYGPAFAFAVASNVLTFGQTSSTKALGFISAVVTITYIGD